MPRRIRVRELRWLVSGPALACVWAPIVVITLAHLITPAAHGWLHDVLRRLYYIPIIVGAFRFGMGGALLASLLASTLYLPHAFWAGGHHHGTMVHPDPAGTANKVLEVALYNAVAIVSGLLAEREMRARRELERKVVEMRAMEHQLVRAGRLQSLGELTAGLAHEIKNPLASLKTAAAIVGDEVAPASPRRKMVAILQKELDRLEMLLERFLAFARPEASQLVPVDLPVVVEQAIALVRPQAELRRVTLALVGTGSAGGVLPEITGDPDKITQALLNVLLNAIQFSSEGGTVEVSLELCGLPHGNFAVARVMDGGPGWPQVDVERVFDPFYSTRPGGTGLGLSIASRIMDAHGGIIEARSRRDGERGAELLMLFPVAAGRDGQTPPG